MITPVPEWENAVVWLRVTWGGQELSMAWLGIGL